MKIRLAGTAEDTARAKARLGDLLREWDEELTEVPASGTDGSSTAGDRKSVDPAAITALVLSIPSTALAVLDISDRIRKRHRADQLIQQTRELTVHGVSITLLAGGDAPEVTTLTPDQLLDRNADE